MKRRRHVLKHPYSAFHHFISSSIYFICHVKKFLIKPYIFWLPLIVASALALTTAAPSYPSMLINDKILHVLTFLYLTAAWMLIDRNQASPYRIVGMLFLHGLLLEWLQSFLPSRTCSLADAAANGAGSLIGLALVRLFQYIRKRYTIVPPDNVNHKQNQGVSSEKYTVTT